MPIPVGAVLGRPIFNEGEIGTLYVRRIEWAGELGTTRVRLYASATTASQAHGDERDRIYNVDWETGNVTFNAEETEAFQQGKPL